MDFANIQERIVCKLVNFEQNLDLLEEIPYIKYLDLAIIFYVYLDKKGLENASIRIHNNHLTMWQVTLEEVYKAGIENTPKLLPFKKQSMIDIMKEMMLKDRIVEFEPDVEAEEVAKMMEELAGEKDDIPMTVLTNTEKWNGAVVLIYSDYLAEMASKEGKNLYILPSSIHECIVIYEEADMSVGKLEEMVKEVNETQVEREEILSNHVYYFDLKTKELTIA